MVQVPRWYGETVGFWDGDVLITWTIEVCTPIRDDSGVFVGLNHEPILYDSEALVEPVRIVRNLNKINDNSDDDATPCAFLECVQTILPVDATTVPTPGNILEYEVPDMYDRPWDTIWRENFEQGMSHPEEGQDIFSLE